MAKGKGFGGNPDVNMDDQAFLSQIEQNIRGKEGEQEQARKEAEQRAREMERIRQANIKVPGAASAPKTQAPASASAKKNPLEDDPRYKEYFQRLKRQKGEATDTPPPADVTPPPGSPAPGAPAPGRSGSQVVGPGAIVHFDDDSIGVYKDAVSGKDYALFYFLAPDGQFEPEGVFLRNYKAKVIGNLPEAHFARLQEDGQWDRDLILYHLSSYDHVDFLRRLKPHEERKQRNATPAHNTGLAQAQQNQTPVPAASSVTPAQAPSQSKAPEPPPAAPASPAPEQNGLLKGRRFRINFGGKAWEAVYWINDDQGAIVAHSTHGNWSLMRLDLDRFKESLELLDQVDSETMTAIAEAAAGAA